MLQKYAINGFKFRARRAFFVQKEARRALAKNTAHLGSGFFIYWLRPELRLGLRPGTASYFNARSIAP